MLGGNGDRRKCSEQRACGRSRRPSTFIGLPRWFRDDHALSRQAALDQTVGFVIGGLHLEPRA